MRTKKTLKFYFHFQTSTIHNILKGQHNCVFFCIPCWFLTEGSQVTLFHGTHSTLSIRRLFQTKWRMKVSVYLFIYLVRLFKYCYFEFFFRLLHYVVLLHPWSDGATKSPTCARLSVTTISSQGRLIYSCWFVFLSVNLFFFLTFQTCDLKNSLYFWKSIRVLGEAILKKCQINVSMILLSKWRFKAVDTRFNSLKKNKREN